MSKLSNICFTAWSYEPRIQELFTYLIVGREICPETGKIHFQCYGELKTRSTLEQLKKKLGTETHIEKRMGSAQQAIVYCMKEGDFSEKGQPKKQGERTDLATVCQMISTHSIGEVAQKHAEMFVKYHKGLIALRELSVYSERKKTLREVNVWFIHGETGSGKTSYVWKFEHESLYILSPASRGGTLWFNGYDGESALLIDDYVPYTIEANILLRMCDRYPLQVQVKGGMVWANWSKVYITSNKTFRDCFANTYEHDGMTRRIPERHRLLMRREDNSVQQVGQEVDR